MILLDTDEASCIFNILLQISTDAAIYKKMSHIQSTSTWNTSTANAQAVTNQLTVPKGPVSHEILVLSDS